MLERVVEVKREERAALLWSFAYFLLLSCAYGILKPLRDEMNIVGRVRQMDQTWLFSATFLAMLVLVPLFSLLVSRYPRHRVIPFVYRFFLLQLLGFFVVLKLGVSSVWVARVFFVWTSVFNLFVLSVFWAFMADVFSTEQSKRLFGFIAAGGTVGFILGPGLVLVLVGPLGTVNLLLLSAVLLEGSLWCERRVVAWAQARAAAAPQARGGGNGERPVGGSAWSGLRLLLSSPFLLALGVQMLLYTITSTFLYFEQQRLVDESGLQSTDRTRLFSAMELATQSLTLVLQVAVTGRVLRVLGLAVGLVTVPLLTAVGFGTLAAAPTLAVIVGLRVLRSAGHYALEKPSREVLFTSVDREAKYKAKSFIDTAVYRTGDLVGAWLQAALVPLGWGTVGVALLGIPFALAWAGTGGFLARRQRTNLAHDAAAPHEPQAA